MVEKNDRNSINFLIFAEKMKRLLIVIILVAGVFSANSQPWNKLLPQEKTQSELTFFDYQKAFYDYWQPFNVVNGKYIDENGVECKASGWKQFKRWEYFWNTRVNPVTGEFPATTAQLEYKKFVAQNGKYESNASNWVSLGTSSSEGGYAGIGRINTIAFHPSNDQIFWIGAPAGGLWQTTDGGNSWTVYTDSNAVLGVSAIAIPSDYDVSHTIYIGTGDRDARDNYSLGVLKSTDGGLTWDTTGLVFNPADKYQVDRLLISPLADSVIYASASPGFYKSTDYGETWTKYFSTEFIDMELCPDTQDTIYGSTRGGEIYRSVDGGETWTRVFYTSSAARIELAVSADDNSVVYALASADDNGLYAILKSVDYGENFTNIYDEKNLLTWAADGNGSGGQGWYDLALAADPNNADVVYCGGVNTWKSDDGGYTWTLSSHWSGNGGVQAVHADKHFLAFRNNSSIIYECNDGGVYNSTDGENWNHLANGLTISQMYGLSTAQTVDNETITGLQDNGTKLNKNGVWTDVIGGDGMLCKIDYTDEKIQYGSLYYGRILRTTDEWYQDYTQISSNIPGGENGAWVTPYEIDPIDHNIIYVGYRSLWKSEDMGDNFEELGSFGTLLSDIAICPTNNKYIYVSSDNNVWMTDDGGSNWESITSGLPVSAAKITDIAVKYNDPLTVWVTMGEFDTNAVYKSIDGGQTWSNISTGLPKIPVNCIVQNHLESSYEQLYIGTDFGVFLKNGDTAWAEFNNNLPKVVVSELDIYYDYATPDNSRLRASTYGRGLWETPLQLSGNYAPLVSTLTAENITNHEADLKGEITNDFGSTVNASGIVLATHSSPFITDDDVEVVYTDPVVQTGNFSLSFTGLDDGTTYYFRAFATNDNGTGYGSTYSFTTGCDVIDTLTWFDGCEDDGNIPNCFSQENLVNTIMWQAETGNGYDYPATAHTGTYNYFIAGSLSNTGSTRLILPTFDLSAYNDAHLTFWLFNAPLFSMQDYLSVWYRNSETGGWNLLHEYNDAVMEWTQYSINLTNLSDFYQISFRGDINGGRGICIDDIYLQEGLGIASTENKDVFVYPNPVKDMVYVDFRGKNAEVSVIDYSGRIIINMQLTKEANSLDLSGVAAGLYLLKINTENGCFVRKIVK